MLQINNSKERFSGEKTNSQYFKFWKVTFQRKSSQLIESIIV